MSRPTPQSLSTSSGQDELSDELSFEQQQDITKILELYRSNPSNSNKYRFELFAKINSIVAHHTKEAVEAAREKAIDDCIAVVRNKQLEDAEELAKRMSELAAPQQSTSSERSAK